MKLSENTHVFQDALVDAFIHQVLEDVYWPTEEAKYVYENTIKDAPLRRVFAAMTAADNMVAWFDDPDFYGESVYGEAAQNHSTVEFLCNVMRLLNKRLMAGYSFPMNEDEDHELKWYQKTCRYHEHVEGKCYRARYGIVAKPTFAKQNDREF